MTSILNLLLGNIEEDVFFSEIWEKKIFHNETEGQSSLKFSIQDVENILLSSKLTSHDLRLSNIENPISYHLYCNRDNSIDIQKTLYYFNRGYTIIIKNLEKFSPQMNHVCSLINSEFGNLKRIFINLYLTPEDNQGFFPHFDNEDVFIVQIEGQKSWSLYNSPYPLPQDRFEHSHETLTPDKSSLKKILLKKGEVLYIPRGLVHEARSTANISCHLTLSLVPYTVNDLLSRYSDELSYGNIEMRKALPRKITNKETLEVFKKMNIDNEVVLSEAIFKLREDINQMTTAYYDPTEFLTKRTISISSSSFVQLNNAVFIDVVYLKETIEIQIARIKAILPIEAKSIIMHLLKKGICKISDIPTKYDMDSLLSIIDRLIKDSFLKKLDHSN